MQIVGGKKAVVTRSQTRNGSKSTQKFETKDPLMVKFLQLQKGNRPPITSLGVMANIVDQLFDEGEVSAHYTRKIREVCVNRQIKF